MAIKPRTYAGLKTVFGEPWGLPMGLNTDLEGGFWTQPDGARPEQPRGVILYCHGFGGSPTDGVSRLALTTYRGANRDDGFYALAPRGTRTSANPDVVPGNTTWFGHKALLPQNTARPWSSGATVAKGERRTNNGRQWYYLVGGITGAAPGPQGNSIVVDGTATACPMALGVGDDTIPDLDRLAGPGRTVDGIFRPMGYLIEFITTSGRAIDLDQIYAAGYSTGGGVVYALLANFASLFAGGWVTSGCNFPSESDPNFAVATTGCNLEIFHGGADSTVNDEDVPPNTSSAAIAPHPGGAQSSINQFMPRNGHPPGTTVANTGTTMTLTSSGTAQVWAPASDIVDARGNTLRHRLYFGPTEGHVPAPNNEFARTMNTMFARRRIRP